MKRWKTSCKRCKGKFAFKLKKNYRFSFISEDARKLAVHKNNPNTTAKNFVSLHDLTEATKLLMLLKVFEGIKKKNGSTVPQNLFQVNGPWTQPSAAVPLVNPTEWSHQRPWAALCSVSPTASRSQALPLAVEDRYATEVGQGYRLQWLCSEKRKSQGNNCVSAGGRGREACKPGRHWVQADDFLIFRINDSNGDPFSSPCNFIKTTDVLCLDRYDRVKSQEVKGGQWVGGERGAGGGKGGVPRKRRLGSFRPSEV